ncbi:MAG TPA: VCBS repeat-containing protein [Ktedonobacteraceae bacterium]|nr:VCBS repeat-containing protein [Ktedonobacteraceae bacterium]
MDEIRLHRRSNRTQRPRITEDDMLNDGEYDDAWPGHLPSSSRRYYIPDVKAESRRTLADSAYSYGPKRRGSERAGIPPRSSATQTSIPALPGSRSRAPLLDEEEARRTSGLLGRMGRSRRRFHWLVFVGIAIFVMILGWIAFNALSNWWQITQDDWHYGRPRTYQVDMAVGHNDSATNPSHFITENLNSHIVIVEIPGGDTSKAKIYTGPTLIGSGQDLTPVTLTFKDVNGDGKLDMIVSVQGAHFVFLNQNGQFVAAPDQNGS